MAILVTGATGLIGRCLFNSLEGDILAASRSGVLPENALPGVQEVTLDLCNERTIDRLPWSNIDIVIHLAAYTKPRQSIEEPHECFTANGSGTSALLTAAHDANVSHFVYTSSYWVFDSGITGKLDESTRVGVKTPYGASKAAAELQCEAFRTQSEMSVTTLRPFNVYGPGASKHQVVPELVLQAIDKRRIEPHPGNPVRDFLHVSDFADAAIACMNAQSDNVFNIGYGRGTSIHKLSNTIANVVENITDKRVEVSLSGPKESSDRKVADIRKIQSRLDWTPKINLKDGLNSLVNHILNSRSSNDA